jgi:nucleotide-binding universal stress UspA family protein
VKLESIAKTVRRNVKMPFKMLIATDGSKYSMKAVDYGLDLAKKLGYDVLGLYVVNLKSLEMFAIRHHDDISGYEDADSELRFEGETALGYVVAKGADLGITVSKRLARGYPAEEIVKVAGQEDVEMIVLGNIGKTGVEHILMGSVSETVVRQAPCPVLVVRGK